MCSQMWKEIPSLLLRWTKGQPFPEPQYPQSTWIKRLFPPWAQIYKINSDFLRAKNYPLSVLCMNIRRLLVPSPHNVVDQKGGKEGTSQERQLPDPSLAAADHLSPRRHRDAQDCLWKWESSLRNWRKRSEVGQRDPCQDSCQTTCDTENEGGRIN